MFGKRQAGAAFLAAAALSAPASAQDAPALDLIEVTGSRLLASAGASSRPTISLHTVDIERAGAFLVEDALNDLPQFAPEQTRTTNVGGAGVATLDLRGLNAISGAPRTLVLVNGRRYMASDEFGRIDVNGVPAALLERVDVVTGGASSVYGSDAVAGAVNFVLRDDFDGVRLGGGYGVSARGDGADGGASLTVGRRTEDDRGGFVLFADYYERGAILAADRDFAAAPVDDVGPPTGFAEIGSSRIPGGQVVGDGRPPVPNPFGQDLDGDGLADPFPAGLLFPDGSVAFSAGFAPNGDPIPAPSAYNFQPFNFLQTPASRVGVFAAADYRLSPAARLFFEASYSQNRNRQQLAPDANDIPEAGVLLAPLNNPLIAANEDLQTFLSVNYDNGLVGDQAAGDGVATLFDVRRRMTENGLRIARRDLDAVRGLIGLDGAVSLAGAPWRYEAAYSYSRLDRAETLSGRTSDARIQQALNAVVDPATGEVVCADPAGGCAPLRLFGEGPESISPEAAAFIGPEAGQDTVTDQHVGSLAVRGSPFGAPGGPAAAAFGVEARREASAYRPDALLQSGELGPGATSAPTEGAYWVAEGFGELQAPLLADHPVAKRLSLHAAARAGRYSTVGWAAAYGGGGVWSPIEALALRGQYQRAVRAPNVGELFSGPRINAPSFSDPCSADLLAASAAQAGVSLAQAAAFCAAQGVPNPGLFLGAPQVIAIAQGAPDLKEETANTVTVGLVLEPPRVGGTRLTLDFYDIVLNQAIDDVNPTTVAALCFQALDLNDPFCQAIDRAPTGQVIALRQPRLNLGRERRRGFDWEAAATLDVADAWPGAPAAVSASRLAVRHLGNYTLTNETQPVPGGASIDCNGVFGGSCSGLGDFAQSRWRLLTTVALEWERAALSARVRVVGPLDNAFADEVQTLAAVRAPAETYVDFALQARPAPTVELTLGLENAFDNDPPILGFGFTGRGGGSDANTDPSLYDVIGRRIFLSAAVTF